MKSNELVSCANGGNMYNCLPCPKCNSKFRWLNQKDEIICDDCGFHEEADKESLESFLKGECQ